MTKAVTTTAATVTPAVIKVTKKNKRTSPSPIPTEATTKAVAAAATTKAVSRVTAMATHLT